MNFRPVLGEQESKLTMTPQISEQRSNLTRGAAWFASKEEVSEYEELLGGDVVFLPAPIAFASEVGGSGLVVWHENDASCALWLEGYQPKFYRYAEDEELSPDGLAQWVRNYASAVGGSISADSVRVYEAAEFSPKELEAAAGKSFVASPALAHIDFSNRGASLAEQCESFMSAAFKCMRLLSAAAMVFIFFSAFILLQNVRMSKPLEEAPGNVYKLAMGETSRSPLSSITRRLRLLTGAGAQLTFDGVLSNFTAAWKGLPAGTDIKIDAIRYGRERTEIEGQTPRTENIELLRTELSKNGFTVKLGDVQQIPGGGLRFTINLTEGGVKPQPRRSVSLATDGRLTALYKDGGR